MAGERRYIPTKQVRKRYGDCSEMTIYRWVRDPRLGFPQPFKLRPGGPNFFDIDELDEFDERRRREALAHHVIPPHRRDKQPDPPAAA